MNSENSAGNVVLRRGTYAVLLVFFAWLNILIATHGLGAVATEEDWVGYCGMCTGETAEDEDVVCCKYTAVCTQEHDEQDEITCCNDPSRCPPGGPD